MKKLLLGLLILFSALSSQMGNRLTAQVACNWKSNNPTATFWDTCDTKAKSYRLFGYMSFNSKLAKCFKYSWTVNGNVVGTGPSISYAITQNGTYNLCVVVTDTCNKCDTSFCSKRTITCVPGNTCNWASRYPTAKFWDSCNTSTKNYSINSYISFNSNLAKCFKYTYTVNGNAVTGNYNTINYKITQNGTYNLCVKVTDTCNNCDTTFCSSRTISCIPSTGCNWASRYPTSKFWDSCNVKTKNYSVNGYLSFNSNLAKCFKYTWSVNGSIVSGNANYIYYNVTKNGTYNLCVKVTDTCNKCDTVFCSSRTISCIPAAGCNWAGQYPNAKFWDSCNVNTKNFSVNGYISFNSNAAKCFKYTWAVNGTVVTGNLSNLNYKVTQNGTYELCVKVKDTCNNCDTVFCSRRTISCIPATNAPCNWKSRNAYTYYWDSCNVAANRYALNGYISFNNNTSGCYKYTWTVNGKVVTKDRTMKFPITQNGTYSICVKVVDTCSKCDTSYCVNRTISCIPTFNKGCNWKNRYPTVKFWDSCNTQLSRYSVSGYVSFNSSRNCFKYIWTVNGTPVSKDYTFNYNIITNGTYKICVKVIDTCNNCDTTFCGSRTVNCIPASSGRCNWKSRYPNVKFWDSCNVKADRYSLNGYLSFNSNAAKCFKYVWAVNGIVLGKDMYLSYPIKQNGTYELCVKVTDTCNNCDTVFCSTRYINCLPGDVLGITNEEINTGEKINVYPNPSEGVININLNDEGGNYILYNISGQMISNGKLMSGNQTIDLSNVPSGCYFLQYAGRETMITKKIMIQRAE